MSSVLCLKDVVCSWWMLSGSWFQAAGPAYEKARSPTLVFRRGRE